LRILGQKRLAGAARLRRKRLVGEVATFRSSSAAWDLVRRASGLHGGKRAAAFI
jgi:hypothetical protein